MTGPIQVAWPWLIGIGGFSGVMLVFTAVESIVSPFSAKRKAKKEIERIREAIKQHLHNLSPDEISILGEYASGNWASRSFYAGNGVVQGLVQKGILYRSSMLLDTSGCSPFNVTNEAGPHIRKEEFQKILDRITKRDSEARQASMDGPKDSRPSRG